MQEWEEGCGWLGSEASGLGVLGEWGVLVVAGEGRWVQDAKARTDGGSANESVR